MVQSLRHLTFDQLQRLSPRQETQQPVRIIDIDEAAIAAYGQWPWSRDRLAEITQKLTDLGAAAVIFDIVFAEQDRLSPHRLAKQLNVPVESNGLLDTDNYFAKALANAPTVLGFAVNTNGTTDLPHPKSGFAVLGDNPLQAVPQFSRTTPVLAPLVKAASGVGNMSLTPGTSSGVVRRIPLLMARGGQAYPALSLEALRVALNENTYLVRGASASTAAIEAIQVGDFTIPSDRNGNFWLHYRPDDKKLYISVVTLLAAQTTEALAAQIKGHIVFIGTSAAGLLDARVTPLGTTIPGVSIHAQALEQILSGDFLYRPDWIDGVEILFFAVLAFGLILVTALLSPSTSLIIGILCAASLLFGSWYGFHNYGLLFDPSFVLLAAGLVQFAMVAYHYLVTDREARFVTTAFARYVSPSVLAEIRKNPARLQLGGGERDLSIMFVDIRNFTPLSEGLSPTDLVAFLNKLFSTLSQCVTDHDGMIDKYIGDSIMAFWNAPLTVSEHQRKAVNAALDMRKNLQQMNDGDAFNFKAAGYDFAEISIGIGINTGMVCVGNLGSQERFDYSVIGDAVNLAARVESACKAIGCDILLAQQTAAELSDYALLGAGQIALKGKSTKQQVYVVAGDETFANSDGFMSLRQAHQKLIVRLSTGHDGAVLLAECAKLARQHAPVLNSFYKKIPGRLTDFVSSPIIPSPGVK